MFPSRRSSTGSPVLGAEWGSISLPRTIRWCSPYSETSATSMTIIHGNILRRSYADISTFASVARYRRGNGLFTTPFLRLRQPVRDDVRRQDRSGDAEPIAARLAK